MVLLDVLRYYCPTEAVTQLNLWSFLVSLIVSLNKQLWQSRYGFYRERNYFDSDLSIYSQPL